MDKKDITKLTEAIEEEIASETKKRWDSAYIAGMQRIKWVVKDFPVDK